MGHKFVHLVIVSDSEPIVFALDLVPVQLVRKGGNLRIWSVTPCCEEVGFDRQLPLCGNNIPCAELYKHFPDCLVLVTYVVLLAFFHVLRFDGCDDGFDCHQVGHILEGVLLPLDLLVLLELEELTTLGGVLNYVVVPGGESHFGLTEDKREEHVLSAPFGCDCCKLLDEVSHKVDSGFLGNGVERDSFHIFSHHRGDGGHCCCDIRHGCADRALK